MDRSDASFRRAAWLDLQVRFDRFRDWENERLRDRPPDYEAALRWMSEATQVAREHDPAWGSLERAEEHWSYLATIQRRLRDGFRRP